MGFRTDEILLQARNVEIRKSATSSRILEESIETASLSTLTRYDDFLCHSHADQKIVVGMKAVLEGAGRTVYVDWIAQPNKPGVPITVANAAKVRNAMKRCRRLVYIHTPNSTTSKWCPWELGYFDALGKDGNRIAYVNQLGSKGSGQEYLDLYTELDRSNLSA